MDPYGFLARQLEQSRSAFSKQVAMLDPSDPEESYVRDILGQTSDMIEMLDAYSHVYGEAWLVRQTGMSIPDAAERLGLKPYTSSKGKVTYTLWKLCDKSKNLRVWLNPEGTYIWGAALDGDLIRKGTDLYDSLEDKVRSLLASVGYVMA